MAVIALLLFLLLMSMRLDGVKHRLASRVSAEVSEKYGIPLGIEELEIRGLNDVRLKNVTLLDLNGDTVVHTVEARAYLQTKRLLDGVVRVNTLVFAAPRIMLSRATPEDELNVQFLVDIINGNKKQEKSKIDLRINQLLVYDGQVSYDVHSMPLDSTGFDANHVCVTDLACNLSLKKMVGDEIELLVRSISGKERCGLELDRLRMNFNKVGNTLGVENLELRTQLSKVTADKVELCADSAWNNITLKGCVESGSLVIDELAPFVELPQMDVPSLAFSVDGFYSNDSIDMMVAACAVDNSFGAKAEIELLSPFVKQAHGHVVLEECFADEKMVEMFVAMAGLDSVGYDVAGKLGGVSADGDISFSKEKIAGELAVACKSGVLAVNGAMASDGAYTLAVNGEDLKLEALTGVDKLQGCDIEVEASGNIKDRNDYANVSGNITNLVFNDYAYAPIGFNGHYAADAMTAKVQTDDPNARMQLTARYDVADERILKLTLKTGKLAPAELNLLDAGYRQEFIFDMNGEYIDYGAGKTIVNAKVDNLSLVNGEDTTFVRNFYVSDNKAGDDRLFVVTSDFASASMYGDFDFKGIFNSLAAILKSNLPVLEIDHSNDAPSFVNDFYYDLAITDSSPLTKALNLPVTVLEPSSIKGVFNERENIFTIDASINKIDYNGSLVRSLTVTGKTGGNGLDINMQFQKPLMRKVKNFDYNNQKNDVVVRVNTNIVSNEIKGIVNWNNFKSDDVMMGMLRLDAALSRNADRELELMARIHNDSVIHKNKVWYINEGTVSGKIDKLFVENIGLSGDNQDLKIEGVIGKEQSDSLNAYLNKVDVATVFDLIKFRILDFGGKASGTAHLTGVLSAPNAGGRLDVSDFSIDGAVLGKGDVYVGWDNDSKSIVLDAGIYNSEEKLSTVKGFLSQANDTITLKIDANDLNAAFMNKKLGAFLSDLDGTGSGKVHLHGQWRSVDMEGAVALFCSAKVNANNTRYYFTGDSLYFSKGTIAFNNARLYDRYGNRGTLNGPLTHKNMGQWTCNFNINVEDMLAYDTDDFGSLPFYGTVFATGDALIKSDGKSFLLKVNAKSMPGSRFVYNTNESSGARDNSFVTFTDNSKRNKKELLLEQKKPVVRDAYSKTASKMTLDFMLDVNDALEVKVYTNRQNDDYITLYGNGPINAVYDDKTGFSMKGHLGLTRGTLKFTIQDIFPKVFEIAKGGTLAFNGDPYHAEMNLKAKYLVPSASLSDLTTEIAKRKTVKVNCVMNVTGKLSSPDLAFDLELPEGSEEERELLASVASTPDQKNMQFVYLLGVGKFYTFDNSAQTGETNSSTAVESLISNTISGQLNNMLGKIINDGNWDISGNISTSERGWNSMEVEGMLRGRLLDNRLQINGNLGYRENPIANRNFIGDFELLWLLNPKYNWNIKAYSKTNDRYFSKTDLTTQGIGTSVLLEFDRWKWWGEKKGKKPEEGETDDAAEVAVETEIAVEETVENGKTEE